MNEFSLASLINLLGFTLGVTLYLLLLVMVVRHHKSRRKSSLDLLLLMTAALGILWNLGELSVFIWRDFGAGTVTPLLTSVSYSALGFLPSVVVHSALKNFENSKGRWLITLAYGLSILAAAFHFYSALAREISLPIQVFKY